MNHSDLVELLTQKNPDGSYVVHTDIVDVVVVRMLIELARLGADVPPSLHAKVGEVCTAHNATEGNPLPILDRVLQERAPRGGGAGPVGADAGAQRRRSGAKLRPFSVSRMRATPQRPARVRRSTLPSFGCVA